MSKYNYNMHSNSTVTNINEKRLDILKAMEEIYEIIKSKYPQYLDIIANNYIGASISIIIDITMENKVKQKYFILKEVKRLFNKNSYIYKECKHVSLKYRMLSLLLKISPLSIAFLYKLRFLYIDMKSKK